MKPSVLLVDANNLFRRRFAVLDQATLAQGPESAAEKCLQSLQKALREHRPTHVACCFDPDGPTWRHDLDGSYKEGRSAPPKAFVQMLPILKQMVRDLGVYVLEEPGYEADDVIATLATRLAAKCVPTVILSTDKDLLQLLGPCTRLYDHFEGAERTPAWVQDHLGVQPKQIRDYLALAGDTSDGIPGVPTIGVKKARRLLSRWGDLDALVAAVRAGEETSYSDTLLTNLETLLLSRQLATLRTDVALGCNLREMAVPESVAA